MPKAARTFIFLIAFFLTAGFTASGQDAALAESRRKSQALEKDIEILRKQLSSTVSKSEQAVNSLNFIQAQQVVRKKIIAVKDAEITVLNRKIVESQREINRQQRLLDTLQAHYSRLVLGAYKNRDLKIWYMYILSSEKMSQAFRRFGYFKNLSNQIQIQARNIEEAKAELEVRKAKQQKIKNEAVKLKRAKSAELDNLKADARRQKQLIAKLKRNTKEYKASLNAKMKEKSVIDKQIARMIADAGKKVQKKKQRPVDVELARNFSKNKGKLPWPVNGPVTEHYGPYQNKELRLSLFNNGINIACDPGTSIKAVFDGVVSNIMIAPGYGQCILIQHGDYYTTYCKVKSAFVRQGDKVKTGQVIGEVATIMGRTQLYFLLYNKKYIDPEQWLQAR